MIPHLGGIALVIGTVGGILLYNFLTRGSTELLPLVRTVAPGVGLIVALGLVDDMRNLRAIQKLVVQILAALLISISGLSLLTGIAPIDASPVLVILVTSIFLVGMSSATNLIDGHDGLATGITILSASAFAIVAWNMGASALVALSITLTGACLGFLIFNFPPGKIFMGDNGSMFLGTMLAVVACGLTSLRPDFYTLAGVALIMGVPIIDAMLAVVRRIAMHSPLFRADSLHMHHVLSQSGYTPRQTLAVLYTMQTFLCALGVMVVFGLTVPAILGGAFALVSFVSFFRLMVASRQLGGRVAADLAAASIPIKSSMQTTAPPQRRSVGS
jgi:UDP-GlcNAc:undecaprenyl-phosphate GlcNAc-1-phosphate transferase